jgi:uncharacterized Zn finger protein (UPF0148 family)
MADASGTTNGSEPEAKHAKSPAEIEAEIEQQRAQLADTVDQLAAKMDVKSKAQAKVASVKESATTDEGKPRPEVLAAAGSLVGIAVVLIVWRARR